MQDSIQASLDSALAELDLLEVPYTASAPPLAIEPVQQMPRGMPPLPFRAPHPRHMPPLPSTLASLVPKPSRAPTGAEGARSSAPAFPAAAGEASARPSRWLMPIALTLGVLCLAVALLLQRG